MNWVKGIPPRYMRDHMGMFTGGENRLGWHGEMDRCWMDNDENLCVCSRIIRTQFGNVEHVTISKGEYQKAINRGYNVSEADVEKLYDDYKRTGKL